MSNRITVLVPLEGTAYLSVDPDEFPDDPIQIEEELTRLAEGVPRRIFAAYVEGPRDEIMRVKALRRG